MPIEGSIALFLAGTAAYLFAIASLGILLATIAYTMPQFSLLAIPGLSHPQHAVGRRFSARKHARAAAGRDPGVPGRALRQVRPLSPLPCVPASTRSGSTSPSCRCWAESFFHLR